MSHSQSRNEHGAHSGHKDDKPADVATPEIPDDQSKVLLKPGAGSHTGDRSRTVQAATPKDTTADQSKLLMYLAADWLNNDRTHQAEITKLLASVSATLSAPVNIDVPYVSQSGGVANCTMGNWAGEPTEYAYAWHSDGVALDGATSATYAVQPDDSGHSLACVVTATNSLGSTAAPMSNAVAIA